MIGRTGSQPRAGRARVGLDHLFLILILSTLTAATAVAATVRGTLVDPHGRPVRGGQAVLVGPLGASRSITTDDDGRFEAVGVPAGRYEFVVSADGLAADAQIVELTDDAATELRVTMRIAARTETLVVTAAQIDVPLSQAADSVTVLSGRDLQARQIATVADALRLVPGMSVAQTGTRFGLTSVFTRGGESDYTLVLIDGLRANAFGGGLDFSQLPLLDVDRIEVVRGPQSALFGSDAIGGVVQIVTRHGSAVRGDATVEGGSLHSWRTDASASGAARGWSWHAAGRRDATDGYTGVAPATRQTVSNDDAVLRHVAAGLGWHAARGTDVRGDLIVSHTERGFPGPYGSNPIGSFTTVDRISRGNNERRQAGLHLLQPWFGAASRVRQRVDASWTDLTSDYASPYGVSASGSRRGTARVQTDAVLTAATSLSAGVEWLGERGTSTYINRGLRSQPLPVNRQVLGTFVEARYAPSARASITAGVRAEHISRDVLPADTSAYTSRPTALPADTVVSVNPKVAAAALVAGDAGEPAWTRVHASAGTGIRPPDAFELAFTDNPGLKPERSRSAEAGVQQGLARGAVLLDATAFFNGYDDLIVAVGRPLRDASRYRTDNISNARARGLELSGGWRPVAGVDVRAAYTWLSTEILAVDGVALAPAPFAIGQPLLRRPRHQFSIDAVLARDRWSAFARVGGRGRILDVDPSWGTYGGMFDAKGYAAVHAGGSVRVTRAVSLTLRAENLLDRQYEEVLGYPALGRTLTAGVRVAGSR